MLEKSVAAMLAISVLTAGCANTTANPVLVAQTGDDTKSCEGIVNEMQQMVQAQSVAEADRNKQIASNVALGVAGAFLLVPWFFLDTGNAATVEERAAKARYQRLNQMQIDRKCPASTAPLQSASTGSGQSSAPAAAAAPAAAVVPSRTGTVEQAGSRSSAAVATASTSHALTPSQPSQSVVKPKVGQDSWNAERLSEVKACAADPKAELIAKGPGFETYTVACSDGNAMAVRCEFGNCRVLQ